MPLTEAASGLLGSFLNAGGSVLNSAIGLVAANHGAYKQYKYNSKLQKEAAKLNYDYAEKSALNSAGWQRASLEGAGYNPMLAVQNGMTGANSSWTSNSSVGAPDYAGLGVGDLVSNATRIQEIKNQTSATESANDKNYAEADEAKARKATILEKLPWISKREKAEIGNIEKDSLLKEAQIHNIDETTRFIEKNYELQKALGFAGIDVQRAGVGAQIYSANKAYNASTYHSNTLKDIADTHSPSGKSMSFENYTRGAEHILNGIGSVIHGYSDLNSDSYTDESYTHSYHDKSGNHSYKRRRRGRK